jgi:hypothetical protein
MSKEQHKLITQVGPLSERAGFDAQERNSVLKQHRSWEKYGGCVREQKV